MEEKKVKFPCDECGNDKHCTRNRQHLKCALWLEWFHQQWAHIRKLFGIDVSNRHEQKGDDDK